jgi:hypothetical protein
MRRRAVVDKEEAAATSNIHAPRLRIRQKLGS